MWLIWGAKVDTINVIDLMIMTFTIMWLYDDDDDNVVVGDDNDDDDDDDDDPYKKVLVEVNKPNFTTSSKIKMCSIIVISYECLRL